MQDPPNNDMKENYTMEIPWEQACHFTIQSNFHHTKLMQTEKLFYEHTSDDSVAAEILEIRNLDEKTAIILDKTIFFPEGGGQPADRGFINGTSVFDVQEIDSEILHYVNADDAKNLTLGKAGLILDAKRRRVFSAQHTGQHIFSGMLFRMLDAPTVSMHMGDETCTIDVNKIGLTMEDLYPVEDKVQDIIEEDCPITIHLCPPEDIHRFHLRRLPPQGEEVIRIVQIGAYEMTPCCGTHLSSSGKVGMFRVISAEKYKGMTRITFIVGRRVFDESRILRTQAEGISRLMNAPALELLPAVQTHVQKTEQLERSLNVRNTELAQFKANQILAEAGLENSTDSTKIYKKLFTDISQDEVLLIAKTAQKKCGCILVFSSVQDKKFCVLASDKKIDIRPLFKTLMDEHRGQGGGGPQFFQGSFSEKNTLEKFIDAIPGRLEA
jgi:alanyl-tRNA synthetase